jgi:hypothetical protein
MIIQTSHENNSLIMNLNLAHRASIAPRQNNCYCLRSKLTSALPEPFFTLSTSVLSTVVVLEIDPIGLMEDGSGDEPIDIVSVLATVNLGERGGDPLTGDKIGLTPGLLPVEESFPSSSSKAIASSSPVILDTFISFSGVGAPPLLPFLISSPSTIMRAGEGVLGSAKCKGSALTIDIFFSLSIFTVPLPELLITQLLVLEMVLEILGVILPTGIVIP